MTTDLEHIAQEITALKYDIKTEVLVSDLIQHKHIKENQCIVEKEGQFARSYRFDVLDASVKDYLYDATQMLYISLSRDSLYDTLPEGMVHSKNADTSKKGIETMVKEYRQQKEEEKAARLFFAPLENELFQFNVQTELFESKFLKEINSTLAPDVLYTLWNVPMSFEPVLASKFISILPYAHKIIGDLDKTCEVLSLLIGEEVKVNIREYDNYADTAQDTLLGDCYLGLDTIAGTDYTDYTKHLDLQIGPLQQTELPEYLHQGTIKEFLAFFYRHFFPMEVEITTEVLLPKEKQSSTLNVTESPSYLGYNTYLTEIKAD